MNAPRPNGLANGPANRLAKTLAKTPGALALALQLGVMAFLLAACGASNVIEPFISSINLLEYETYSVQVRYRDQDGLPIAAASIRFSIKPNHAAGNGAMFLSPVVVTGDDGVATVQLKVREETAFLIEADADDAEEPARINVAVSKDSGGRIDVSIYQASAVEVIETEVILVEDLECDNFDEFEPPPATAEGVNTNQVVAIEPGKASDVSFRGLKPDVNYTVAAIGRAGSQIVARGCRDNNFITLEMIDEKRAKPVSLDMEDRLVTPVGSELSVITKFKNNIGLTGIAGLLKSMAGNTYGPAEYVMSQMELRAADSHDIMKRILSLYRAELEPALAGRDGDRQGARLIQAASALASVEDVQLHSRMSIADETQDGVITDELQIKHKMHKFTAVIEEGNGQMLRRDFPLLSLADPRLAGRRSVFAGSALKLEDTATMKVEDAARVSISPHQMSLPITDAVMGQILFDHFGDWNLERIVGQMVHCDAAGMLADSKFQQLNLYDWTRDFLGKFWGGIAEGLLTVTIRSLFTDACQQIVTDVLAEAQRRANEELKAFRSDQYIVFEGSANMLMLGDGVTIGWLKNGNWTGVGTFEAKRD